MTIKKKLFSQQVFILFGLIAFVSLYIAILSFMLETGFYCSFFSHIIFTNIPNTLTSSLRLSLSRKTPEFLLSRGDWQHLLAHIANKVMCNQ